MARPCQRLSCFADLLESDEDGETPLRLREGERMGLPIGSVDFLTTLDTRTGRRLRPLLRGPKPTERDGERV